MTSSDIRYWAIVPAAGSSRRFDDSLPKQYVLLQGKPVIAHTLQQLFSVAELSAIVLVHSVDDPHLQHLPEFRHEKIIAAIGGNERVHSVLNGLNALQNDAVDNDWVLVHDAARPCCTSTMIKQLIDQISDDSVGGLLAIPVVDTVKQVDVQQRVIATLDRSQLWRAQTPQMFRYGILRKALAAALEDNIIVTDEAQAVERIGYSPRIVMGTEKNIKITRKDDLLLAEFYLQQHSGD